MESRYNEDPVITRNVWKPGRITVKYLETNLAIAIDFDGPNAQFISV